MSRPDPTTSSRRGDLLFVGLLVALQLAVVWSVHHFPSQDGPIHLEIADVLRAFWHGDAGTYDSYYQINPRPEPNWLTAVLLAAGLEVAPPWVAEKLLLTLYLLLWPLAFAYALRAVRPGATFLVALALPLSLNFPLHMGFYNFALGLPLSLLTLGAWLRWRERLSPWRTAALALLLLACHFAHLVAVGFAMVVITVTLAWDLARAVRAAAAGARLATLWRGLKPHLAGEALAFLPTVILVLAFLHEQAGRALERLPLRALVKHLALLFSLVSYDRRELLISVSYGLLLAVLGAIALRRRRARPGLEAGDGWLLALGVFLALYFLLPVGLSGGGYVNQRLQLFLPMLAILWLASQPDMARLRRPMLAASSALTLTFLALHWASYQKLDRLIADFEALAPQLPADTTLLVVARDEGVAGEDLVFKVHPLEHAAGYLAVGHHIVDLSDYQAAQGYFPIGYRKERDPYPLLPDLATDPELLLPASRLDVLGYEESTHGRVAFLVLWGVGPTARAEPGMRALLRELEKGYRLVATSPLGLAELYQRLPAG